MRILFNSSWYLYIGVVLKGESRFSPALFLYSENHALNELIIEAFYFLGAVPRPRVFPVSRFPTPGSDPRPRVFPPALYFTLRILFPLPGFCSKALLFLLGQDEGGMSGVFQRSERWPSCCFGGVRGFPVGSVGSASSEGWERNISDTAPVTFEQ